MAIVLVLSALLGLSRAASPASADGALVGPFSEEAGPPAPEYRRALAVLNVRRAPDPKARLRGLLQSGATFRYWSRVEGAGCEAGWGKIDEDAFVCLIATEPSIEAPETLPQLVAYPMPTLEESATYSRTGVYTGVPGENPILPYIYGRRGRHGPVPVYASAAAYAAGEAKVGLLETEDPLLFVNATVTDLGEVLVRRDGTVVPSAEVVLYAIDRFRGRDMVEEVLPAGTIPAWATLSKGTPVYATPSREAEVGATLDYRSPLLLRSEAADAEGRWWVVPDGISPGVPGYVEDRAGLRHATVVPPPADVGDTLWVDVDLSEQVLMVWQAGVLRYATLVSTGKAGHATPTGIFRIADKAVSWDMASLPDAEEPYRVEGVPWVMHFAPRYALHGAFWHSSFGRIRSHGCVNLAPLDAHRIFDMVAPTLDAGWSTVFESPLHPGTTIRIRDGILPVQDRRSSLK